MATTKKGFPLRADISLLSAVTELAEQDNRSVNNYITNVLSEHVASKWHAELLAHHEKGGKIEVKVGDDWAKCFFHDEPEFYSYREYRKGE
jgi:hypothetical protein